MQLVHAAIRAHARACLRGSRLTENQHWCNTSIEFLPKILIMLWREKSAETRGRFRQNYQLHQRWGMWGGRVSRARICAFWEVIIALSVLSSLRRAYKTIEDDDLKFPLIYGEGKKVRWRCARWVALQARPARRISAHRTPSGILPSPKAAESIPHHFPPGHPTSTIVGTRLFFFKVTSANAIGSKVRHLSETKCAQMIW